MKNNFGKNCVYFAVFLVLLDALVFCACINGNVGGDSPRNNDVTQEEDTKEDSMSDKPCEEDLNLEKYAYVIFNDLSEEIKKQITKDFLEAIDRGFFNDYLMSKSFGTRNDWVVIGFGSASDVIPRPLIVDGTMYLLPLHNMHVWKHDINPEKYNFYTLQEAYDLGFLALGDLQGIIREVFYYE